MDVFLEIYRGFDHIDDTLRFKTEKGQMVTTTLDFDDAHEKHTHLLWPFIHLSLLLLLSHS